MQKSWYFNLDPSRVTITGHCDQTAAVLSLTLPDDAASLRLTFRKVWLHSYQSWVNGQITSIMLGSKSSQLYLPQCLPAQTPFLNQPPISVFFLLQETNCVYVTKLTAHLSPLPVCQKCPSMSRQKEAATKKVGFWLKVCRMFSPSQIRHTQVCWTISSCSWQRTIKASSASRRTCFRCRLSSRSSSFLCKCRPFLHLMDSLEKVSDKCRWLDIAPDVWKLKLFRLMYVALRRSGLVWIVSTLVVVLKNINSYII